MRFHMPFVLIWPKKMTDDKLKIVTTLHGTDITVLGYDPSLNDMIRFGIEGSDVVTAVSESLVQQTYDLLQPKKAIQTVYNFIDERVYSKKDTQDLKAQYGISDDEKVVIHVSNFRKVKRVQDVVKSFHLIEKQVASKLLLVGDGPEISVVCNLVKELGLKDKVLFLGKQENLEDLYSISDLMLLLSEKESFGLVLLEAMACGVPSVGTKIGGIPEVIDDGVTGYLSDVGNVEDIAQNAVKILANPALHNEFAENAISRVKKHFSSQKIVEQYEDMYKQLIKHEG